MEASRDHGHLDFHLGGAYMGQATEARESLILMCKLSKDRWLVARSEKCKGIKHRWPACE